MAWQAPGSQTTSGTTVNLGSSDSVFVASNAVLSSTGSNVVRGTGADHQALIYGTVVGAATSLFAVHLGDSANLDHGQSVHVEKSGHVQALDLGAAIAVYGYGSEVINEGIVSSISGVGVVMRGSNSASKSVLVNTGTIEGDAGVTRFGVDAVGETIVIRNSGTITGQLAAYTLYATEGGAAKDLVTNTGKMVGDVDLFKGDDLYDGRKGFIDGAVNAGDGNDRIFGGREKNVLNGQAGADTISGGLGADEMAGGIGPDDFIFRSVADSRPGGKKHDTIGDFSHAEGDTIDLRTIDADTARAGNQNFHFIGDKAFSGDPGELRFQSKSGDTLVLADTDGDGKADFEIQIDGAVDFAKSDFIL